MPAPTKGNADASQQETTTARAELIVFVILVALLWPILAIGVVGGYGFIVWMYQLIAGPPGPPAG